MVDMHDRPLREIRAVFTDENIRIYQAYGNPIADSALKSGNFVSPPFSLDRMTWIKPSFLWMMYRAGWGEKLGQESILSIDINRDGFEWALNHGCLSHFESRLYGTHDDWLGIKSMSPVRIQWDPERDIRLKKMDYRSIQIGLSGEAVRRYVSDWIVELKNITPLCKQIRTLVKEKRINEARDLLPEEKVYPLPEKNKKKIGMSY